MSRFDIEWREGVGGNYREKDYGNGVWSIDSTFCSAALAHFVDRHPELLISVMSVMPPSEPGNPHQWTIITVPRAQSSS
jgi:hypothetical protein